MILILTCFLIRGGVGLIDPSARHLYLHHLPLGWKGKRKKHLSRSKVFGAVVAEVQPDKLLNFWDCVAISRRPTKHTSKPEASQSKQQHCPEALFLLFSFCFVLCGTCNLMERLTLIAFFRIEVDRLSIHFNWTKQLGLSSWGSNRLPFFFNLHNARHCRSDR